jgi:hypothetical protein
MNEIFVWWPLIVAVPVAIVLGVAIAAMFSEKPYATSPRPDAGAPRTPCACSSPNADFSVSVL